MRYDYRVVPAPTKGIKAKGLKTGEARFALAVEEVMNDMAADGWEYQRTETLPSTERSGLTSTATQWRNLLVFRKESAAQNTIAPLALDKPAAPVTRKPPLAARRPQTPEDDASESEGATRMLRDNGVEEVSEVSGITNSLKRLAATRNISKSKD